MPDNNMTIIEMLLSLFLQFGPVPYRSAAYWSIFNLITYRRSGEGKYFPDEWGVNQ